MKYVSVFPGGVILGARVFRVSPTRGIGCVFRGVLWPRFRCVWLATALAVSSSLGLAAPPDHRTVLLKKHGLAPTAESLGNYLCALHPDDAGRRRIAQMLRQLGDDDFLTRENTMRQLGNVPVIPEDLLRAAIDGEDPEIRWRAALVKQRERGYDRNLLRIVLSVIEQRQIKGLAGPLLNNAPMCEPFAFEQAFYGALAATSTPKDAEVAELRLDYLAPATQAAAVEVLSRLKGAEATRLLRPLLVNENQTVRLAAAAALLGAGERAALPVLAKLLDASDRNVRARSIHILRTATGQWFGYEVNGAIAERAKAARAWQDWTAREGDAADLHPPIGRVPPALGRTLICLRKANKVIELNSRGDQVWETSIQEPCGCHGLINGHRLIASYSGRRIVEFDENGKLVWSHRLTGRPFSVRRLDNGNVLVATTSEQKVLEISPARKTVWQVRLRGDPMDARRLPGGTTLIPLQKRHTVVEVDRSGRIVWSVADMRTPRAAQRLPNGNTLVAQTDGGAVVEVTPAGVTVWKHTGLARPCDCQRLPNGNTLLIDNRGVYEVNPKGKTVRSFKGRDVSAVCGF